MKPFHKVYLEVTSVCNLSCSFCPPTERRAEFVDPDEFRRRLREVRPFTSLVALHVKGEPLLHPRIGQLLDACAEESLQAVITTNGTLLSKARDKLLGKPALRQINLSLHSFEGGGPDRLDLYLSPMLAFAREAAAAGIAISFRLWNGDASSAGGASWDHSRLLLDKLSAHYPEAGDLARPLAPGSGIKLAERIYLNRDLVFAWPRLDAPEDDGSGFCHGLRTHAAVLADGTVVPCCLDGEGTIRLGNLHDASFADILASERAVRLKDGFSEHKAVEELCRKCGFRKKFG